MINVSKKKKIGKYLFGIIIAAYPLYSAANTWLWKIDNTEYPIEKFSQDYNAYVELMAWQMGASSDDFKMMIEKADEIKDPRTKALIEQLKASVFAENFLLLSLLKKHAVENKFFEKPETEIKSKFINDYILLQIYLNDLISRLPVSVKDEDVEKEWVSQREKNENLKSVPIDQGLVYMRQKMLQEKKDSLRKEFIKSLQEKYKIEKNSDYTKLMDSVHFQK